MSRSLMLAQLVVACGLIAPGMASAKERDLALVEEDIARLGLHLKTLVSTPLEMEEADRGRRFEERLTDAEILYLLNDPSRASLILYELVRDRANERQPRYGKALFYLAESLFAMKHDFSARDFFQELVRRRDDAHLSDAVRRLIQIADRIGRFEGVEDHVAVLRAKGEVPPDIAYILAKSLVRRGSSEQAREAARAVSTEHRLYAKAQYLIAVAEVQLGRYGEARRIFEALSGVSDTYEDAARIRDLAAMNRGRLLLEEGDLVASIDAYQFVDRRGPLFEESLFEATWTFVRAADRATDEEARLAEYGKARRALEILLLSDAETPLVPEARLLLGNIMLRLGLHDDATAIFDDVVARYGPVRAELQSLLAEIEDPREYYEEVAHRSKMGDGLLPPLALCWAENERELQRALGVVQEIGQSEAWVKESAILADKLLAVLDSEQRTAFFPKLQDAQSRGLEIRNSLVTLNRRLLQAEREITQAFLDPTSAGELRQVMDELTQLEPEYRKLPQRKEEYEGRAERMRGTMRGLDQEVFRLKFEIESMRGQIRALNHWLAENGAKVAQDIAESARERIDQQSAVIAELERTQQALAAEVERAQQVIGVTSSESSEEDHVRSRYQALLERQQQILAAAHGKLGGQAQQLMNRILAQRSILAGYNAEVASFTTRLDEKVSIKVADLKAQVLRERGMLDALSQASEVTRREAEQVVGEVAYGSIDTVRKKFHDIILRADVGVVDVAWRLKELKTVEITKRVAEQRRELEILDSEFQEILNSD